MSPIFGLMIDKAMRLIARGLSAGRLTTVVSGFEHIPADGPALIVARHYHHFYDGLALFAALPRPFHIVVTIDWAKNQRTRHTMETLARLSHWPVVLRTDAVDLATTQRGRLFTARDVVRYQRKAVREAVELLGAERIVVVFPEGYPNIDPHHTPKTRPDEFLPFKPGFVNIAATAEKRLTQAIPIIPAGIRYTPGTPWLADLKFGEPAYRNDFADARGLISHFEACVRHLSGID